MSFTGDLEHLPIVDVIQLLHSTRKTGTLCIKSSKGESQLVFNDGYFVGANHLNNSVRIGQVLEEMSSITHGELEGALQEQKKAGVNRKPLIATLIEQGTINKDEAYKGLETLIEMTIVEVLTWTSGTFSLDVTKIETSDEYRYFPETLNQEIHMDVQSILMDALRIYDEKMRDGTLTDLFMSQGEISSGSEAETDGGNQAITADILGLDAIDTLEKRIPYVFSAIRENVSGDDHRKVIEEELQGLPESDRNRIYDYLTTISGQHSLDNGPQEDAPALAVILFSRDRFFTHAVATLCKHDNLLVFTTDEEMHLDMIIEQSLSKDLLPVLVMDAPDRSAPGTHVKLIADLQQKHEKYPQIVILQLVLSNDYEFSLHALHAGVRTVLPRPDKLERTTTFVDDLSTFLTAFTSYLRMSFSISERRLTKQFNQSIHALDTLKDAPDLVFILLRFASSMLERTITFVVSNSELVAEKGIGIKTDKRSGPSAAMRFKLSLGQPSVFLDTVERGQIFCGQTNDAIVVEGLFKEIGAPYTSTIILVPIKSFGKVIALIYGDFGPKASSSLRIDLLDILARHAGLALDNTLYQKRYAKSS